MKTFFPILFVVFSASVVFDFPAQGQVTARRITRRITETNSVSQPAAPAQAQSTVPQTRVLTNAAPEKTKEQKEEMARKTIQFQMKQAEQGAPTAQYDLGMRYLNGDGVEKNLELAEKWLQASAKNGNNLAAKKLEELKKK